MENHKNSNIEHRYINLNSGKNKQQVKVNINNLVNKFQNQKYMF